MELAKAGVIVFAMLLICPFEAYSGSYSSYPIERILRNLENYNNHQHHHQRTHSNDRHDNSHQNNVRDLRWSRPQEFEIIQANKDIAPVLVLGKPSRENDNREVNDPIILNMEAKPVDTQYEIITAKVNDQEQKPKKVSGSTGDKKRVKGRKPQLKPRASVQESLAVNSLNYSKISRLNK